MKSKHFCMKNIPCIHPSSLSTAFRTWLGAKGRLHPRLAACQSQSTYSVATDKNSHHYCVGTDPMLPACKSGEWTSTTSVTQSQHENPRCRQKRNRTKCSIWRVQTPPPLPPNGNPIHVCRHINAFQTTCFGLKHSVYFVMKRCVMTRKILYLERKLLYLAMIILFFPPKNLLLYILSSMRKMSHFKSFFTPQKTCFCI